MNVFASAFINDAIKFYEKPTTTQNHYQMLFVVVVNCQEKKIWYHEISLPSNGSVRFFPHHFFFINGFIFDRYFFNWIYLSLLNGIVNLLCLIVDFFIFSLSFIHSLSLLLIKDCVNINTIQVLKLKWFFFLFDKQLKQKKNLKIFSTENKSIYHHHHHHCFASLRFCTLRMCKHFIFIWKKG